MSNGKEKGKWKQNKEDRNLDWVHDQFKIYKPAFGDSEILRIGLEVFSECSWVQYKVNKILILSRLKEQECIAEWRLPDIRIYVSLN